MYTRVGLAPRFPGMPFDEFLRLWDEHAQYAMAVPGRLGYVQNFPVTTDGQHLLQYPGFDVCAETDYESREAMNEAFSTPESAISYRDHDKFIDNEGYCYILGERRILRRGRPPATAVKLMTFIRAHPAQSREALFERLSGEYAQAVEAIGPIRHEQLFVDPEEGRPHVADALDMIWFTSADDALAYLRSAAGHAAALTLASRVFGTERLIAAPRVNLETPGLY